MRVLITGGGGFLAGHLLAELQTQSEIEAYSLIRAECDLSQNSEKLSALLRTVQPDCILHLAGRINGSESDLFRDNQIATRNLLAAVRETIPDARVVLGSTAAVYGSGGSEASPLTEEHKAVPQGNYATSKYAAEEEARAHGRSGGWVTIARMSNPIGTNMSAELFCGTLARQIVEIEQGKPPILVLRDLTPKRDFLSTRDCVRALWQIADLGASGTIYNVASGVSTQIAEIVEIFLDLARVRPIEVNTCSADDERSSVSEQWLSNSRLRALGWKPEVTVRQAICEVLEAERAHA